MLVHWVVIYYLIVHYDIKNYCLLFAPAVLIYYLIAYYNTSEKDSDTVSFIDFIEDPESGIISQQQLQLNYDDSFRKEVWNNIDSLPFNSVEKVLKSEGEGFTAGYSALSSNHVSIFGIIMMFICLFILLFIYISIIIRKGINK